MRIVELCLLVIEESSEGTFVLFFQRSSSGHEFREFGGASEDDAHLGALNLASITVALGLYRLYNGLLESGISEPIDPGFLLT